MSKSTERTKQAEADMKQNWNNRLPERIAEQDERHAMNQKIQKAQEKKALERKIAKRRMRG